MKNVLLSIAMLLSLFSCSSDNESLPTVEAVDLDQYKGKWYEIARLPNSFEDGLSCVTAEYSLREDGKITVLNSGTKENGKRTSSEGTARLPDPEAYPGRLKVSFFWPFSGDYYIISLDQEYQWALVGAPNRDYLWILSRTPSISPDVKQELLSRAKALGFYVDELHWTEQNCNV